MGIKRVTIYRNKRSGIWQVRERVPADVLRIARGRQVDLPVGDTVRSFRLGSAAADDINVSLRTADKHVAERWGAAVEAALRDAYALIRAEPGRAETALSDRQVVALSGVYYRDLIGRHGTEENLDQAADIMLSLLADAIGGDAASHRLMEKLHGEELDKYLLHHRITVNGEGRMRLLKAFNRSAIQAWQKLAKEAAGDFRPDPNAVRYPEWAPADHLPPRSASNESFDTLFNAWRDSAIRAGKRERSTLDFQSKWADFQKFVGHDRVETVTRSDVQRWLDDRIDRKVISPRTAQNKYLAAVKAVFARAVVEGLLQVNPAAGGSFVVGVDRGEEKAKDIPVSMILSILGATRSVSKWHHNVSDEVFTASRWVPWILAYTGCRISEAVQLRKEDFWVEADVEGGDEIPCVRFSPDAGSVKNNRERKVALHDALVGSGLWQFVQSAPSGPLFCRKTTSEKERVHEIARVGDGVRKFIKRTVSLPQDVDPNHGFRHALRHRAEDAGIEDKIIRAMQGHWSRRDGSSTYSVYGLRAQRRALARFPAYPVAE